MADLIRDTFKRGKYQDVILPLTVLRRLDCVLAPTKRKVLAVQARFKGGLDNLDPQLRRASGFAFYNTSRYDFEKLLADAPHIAQNLRNHLRGAHPEVQRGAEREPRRALHAARRRPPHGRPAAGRRPDAPAHEGRRAQRLRPVLRLGRHAHHRQGARNAATPRTARSGWSATRSTSTRTVPRWRRSCS